MPRRRNNNQFENEIPQQPILIQQQVPQKPVNYMVNDYLKDDFYEMKLKLNQALECSICLDKICCKRCMALLPCGHSFHLACLLKCNFCPLCRA
jgi:hypothetical protein